MSKVLNDLFGIKTSGFTASLPHQNKQSTEPEKKVSRSNVIMSFVAQEISRVELQVYLMLLSRILRGLRAFGVELSVNALKTRRLTIFYSG